jgi:hypothetical protein
MRELVRGKNTIGPEVIDPGGRSVEKPREVTLTLTLTAAMYHLIPFNVYSAYFNKEVLESF